MHRQLAQKKEEKNLRSRGAAATVGYGGDYDGESTEIDSDKAIHRYFRDHWLSLFLELGVRTTFLRQAANLLKMKQQIREILVKRLLPGGSQISIADDFPMPICGFRRAHFYNFFKESSANGYYAAKAMRYYGLKGYLLIAPHGVILNCEVAKANIDEREMLLQQDIYTAIY